MDSREQFERRRREINSPKVLFFKELVECKFCEHTDLYSSFRYILFQYEHGRIDYGVMFQLISSLFSDKQVWIRGFHNSFPQPMSTKDDDVETPRPAKKAKTEGDGSKAITVLDLTSEARYASNYSQSGCSSGCDPLQSEAVASCSSSPPSQPGNAAEAYEAQKEKPAPSGGRTLYVTATKDKLSDMREAYKNISVLVKQIELNRFDIYAIMEYASDVLKGYPELLESFNIFLPDGFRIVVVSADHEMNTD